MKPLHTALALTLAAALAACGADDPASLMTSARQYLDKRQFGAAVIQLKNVLQDAPANAEARYLLGLALLEQGDAVSAQIELDKAVELGFSGDELQVALARAALAAGEPARVLERFGAKSLASPNAQAELRALVGIAHLARGQANDATAAFDQSLKLDPGNVTANLGAARLAAAAQDLGEAMVRVDRALGTSPAHLQALLLKGELLAHQGQGPGAEQAYRAAIEAAPDQAGPRLALVTHLLRTRAADGAAAEAAAMEKALPKDPRTFYAKALILVQERKFAEAKEAIQQVLKVAPEHVPSLTLAGMAALETGALPEAESHLRKAVFNAPHALAAKRLLATTHLRMGQIDLAASEVDELLKASSDPGIAALAGEVYLAQGDIARAASHYERASAGAPKSTVMQTRLALIRLAAGESERAISELEAAAAGDATAYQADLALIATYLRRREPDKALEAIAALEKKQPKNPMTHNLRGVALLLKKDARAGRASFEQALALQPAYMPAVGNLMQLDVREKKYDAAKKRYQEILAKQPNHEQALLGLAVLLRVSGADAHEIEKPLKQSVAANPASVNARLALVNFYIRNRDFKAALSAAHDAQAAIPDNARVVQALGATQLSAGDTRQAIASFTRLADLSPKAAEPHVLLARAHLAAKQPDEAIKALRAALAIRPDLSTAQRDIAAIYLATNRHGEALREAKAAQAERPKDPLGHILEAEIYVAQKKLDMAERTYRAALKQLDMPLLAIRTHATLEAAGKRPEAESLARDWIKRHPKDAVMLAYLAEQDIVAKRYDSAATHYRAALERMPDNAMFLNNLAWVTHELKRPQALEYAERALELAPDSPAVMDTLGTILAGSGQTERALELLGRAAELAPEAHQIRLNFAKALLKSERKAAARKELEQLAKLDSRLPVQQEAARLLAAL